MQDILFFIKKYAKDMALFLLIVISLGVAVYGTFIRKDNHKESFNEISSIALEQKSDEKSEEQNLERFFVDIKGAVKNPGVYQASSDTVVNDIIKLAGGFNSNAYKDGINLSKKLKAEMVIYVYTKEEIKKYLNTTSYNVLKQEDVCNTPDYNICECIQDKKSIIQVDENSKQDSTNNNTVNSTSDNAEQAKININTASIQELTTLTGIGESKAQAIIQYRQDNGNFKKLEDLMNVSGIGEKAFEKIKDFITI